VLPAYRGRGLQRKLIAIRERKAKRLGFTATYSDTYCNPHSSNNLIASGYRMFTPPVEYGAEGTCYWKKNLS
jgi:GNAT superfamily N-acetyltransferase